VREYVREFRRGTRDLSAFMSEHDPDVIVWDIAVPSYMNWKFLQEVQQMHLLQNCGLVITTPNVAQLDHIVGAATGALEVTGEHADVETLARAISQCVMERLNASAGV
jgi:DNA-binding NarL/FixJ family response regulator